MTAVEKTKRSNKSKRNSFLGLTMLLLVSLFFCIILEQCPTECCSFRKIFLILWCYWINSRHIESVFAVLSRKCGSFHKRGQTNSTHFLYSYVAVRLLRTYPHTIQVWGIVSFITVRSFHNLRLNKRESSPHFLFIY